MSSKPLTEEDIFKVACKLGSPELRADYLRGACGDDPTLIDRLTALLRVHDEEQGFLEAPPPGLAAPIEPPSVAERPGQTIGRYKLLELIGEGGFGTVYLAEQQEPVQRQVALKIIKLGMDTKQVIARFEAERQALAMMDHPNIAKVLDAGATDTGRPYFVMERVRGVPITEHCDHTNLKTRERLALFIDVCRAVQHAHQRGIIHRDIKPSNVVVALVDGRPVPKVIDFGIAKATDKRLTEKASLTSDGQFLGTPQYMSPEQAGMSDLHVDIRTDVYSLGVLLYELLVGSTPFDPEQLRQAGYDELCRIIRETDPPTPSKHLSTLGATTTEVSQHRQAQPATLRKLIRGDLDCIVMKAIEKDRDDRYASAQEVADDLQRHLEDKPITAKKPSLAQKLSKWSRRHTALVWSAVVVLIVVIVALSATVVLTMHAYQRESLQRRLVQREAERARKSEAKASENAAKAKESERVARDSVDRMVIHAGELKYVPHAQPVRQKLLQDALEFYERFLQHNRTDPELRHETGLAWQRVGSIHNSLGNHQSAAKACRKAIAILDELVTEFPDVTRYRADLALSHRILSVCLNYTFDFAGASDEAHRASDLYAKLATDNSENRAYLREHALTYVYEATFAGKADQHEHKERCYRQSLASWTRFAEQFSLTPNEMADRAETHLSYGGHLRNSYRFSQAEDQLREALALQEQALQANDPELPIMRYRLAGTKSRLGHLMNLIGQYDEAASLFREAITSYEELGEVFPSLPERRRQHGFRYRYLSDSLVAMGWISEAEESIRHSLQIAEDQAAKFPQAAQYNSDVGTVYRRLGTLLHHDGRHEESRLAFAKAREQLELAVGKCALSRGARRRLALLLAICPVHNLHHPDHAVTLARESLKNDRTKSGRYWQTRGVVEYHAGNYQNAIDALQMSRQVRSGGDCFDRVFLAMSHWQLGDTEAAHRWYDEANDAELGGPRMNLDFTLLDLERFLGEAERLLSQTADHAARG